MTITLQFGIDVGGTFTDVVALDTSGRRHYLKTPSTPQDQSIGVLNGVLQMLNRLGSEPSHVQRLAHGTTVATNAFLERKGATTALLVTGGFRDVLHIGRQARPDLYDLRASRPAPLVPRRWRYEVHERSRHTGQIEQTVDADQIRTIVAELRAANVESLAICFLHSYINPENERIAAELVRALAPALPVSVSSQILPEFREFERMNTTVLNAYVQPVMARYIQRLVQRVEEADIATPLMVMQSTGGMMSAAAAAERSVHTLLSGPAGGVLAATHLAEQTGHLNCITADVGGTSFDVATIINGKPAMQTEGEVEGYPVKFPHIDIHTIGAGGGSIAWIDAGGALRVGPQSAGAEPGPVSYGNGGTEPTVTDAHAVLGHFGNDVLLAETLPLDVDQAQAAIHSMIAEPLGMTVEEAAAGILRVVNAGMARAIRLMTVERGLDPRNFVLVPFGGAGPLHSLDIARQLGIGKVLVPVAPGNFSAFGLLVAPIRYDSVRTYIAHGAAIDFGAMNGHLDALQTEIATQLQAEALNLDACRFVRQADLRYLGQSYELTVDLPDDALTPENWPRVEEGYHQAHERFYGFAKESDPVEVVNLRLTGLAEQSTVDMQELEETVDGSSIQPVDEARLFVDGAWVSAAVIERGALAVGQEIRGPAIIRESGSTAVLGSKNLSYVDAFGNLIIELSGDKA
ncbi:MAG: hydantoinase/oxoprolinase family protein [Chloroflexota bacterium]